MKVNLFQSLLTTEVYLAVASVCACVRADTSTQSPSTTENPGSLVPPDKPDFSLQLTASASDAQMFFVLSSSLALE